MQIGKAVEIEEKCKRTRTLQSQVRIKTYFSRKRYEHARQWAYRWNLKPLVL